MLLTKFAANRGAAIRLLALASALCAANLCFAQSMTDETKLAPSLSISDDMGMSPAELEISNLLMEAARYEHGEGIPKDAKIAQSIYCKAIAMGSSDALVRLGWMYANGRGVPRDDGVAAGLFKSAAQAGHSMGDRLTTVIRSDNPKPSPCPAGSKKLMVDSNKLGAQKNSAAVGPVIKLGVPAEFRQPMSSSDQRKLMQSILKMSSQFHLDPRLVMAVIQQESSFDPNARSPKNAQGLMQLIPETAERFAVKDPFDPLENVRGGMAYLRWLLSYFRGDVTLVLAGYNAGEGTVDKYKGVPPFAETLAYVQRIRALYPLDMHPFEAKIAGKISSAAPISKPK
jgi:Transglycosylase SLT domain/Sel1 repeat